MVVYLYLKEVGFFIIPVFGTLAAFPVTMNQKVLNPFLLFFFVLPAAFIYAPFIKMFSVGLGLKMMLASTLFTTLLFFLILPLIGQLKNKERLAYLLLFLFVVFSISAYIKSDFNEKSPKPSSLLYLHNTDMDSAIRVTYDNVLIDWSEQFLVDKGRIPSKGEYKMISSKYRTGFAYVKKAPRKEIPPPLIATVKDTVMGDERLLEICVSPKRSVNLLYVYSDPIRLNAAKVNGIPVSNHFLENRRERLVAHYISDNDHTELELRFPKDSILELTFYEASKDLLASELFPVLQRPTTSISMPFVLNAAILAIKTLGFE